MKINERVKALRMKMKKTGITAYIIPTSDPHQSEYVAEYYKGRSWISGFTGSAGLVIVTGDEAILWTDGRYFVQAEKQLSGSEFKLFKMNTPGYPSYTEWLKENIKDGDTIGFDGKVYAQSSIEELEKLLEGKDVELIQNYDLIDEIWNDRVALPKGEAFILEESYSGKSSKEKIKQVREQMTKQNADYFLLGSLDDIAWLYNIRGKDIETSPIVISYALVSMEKAYLFVDKDKINNNVKEFLTSSNIEILDYDGAKNFIEKLESKSKILLDKDRINGWLYSGISSDCIIIDEMNITTKLKGIKNQVEIENQKKAYIKDGIALVKFFKWIDDNLGQTEISEMSAQEMLLSLRQTGEGFIEPSFGTISAYKENAAMMHYSASETSNSILKEEGLYLVDSGGQYFDGTTDITRTVALGTVTDEEKRDFTLTLKGHINLISARFLEGTSGHVLDILSRYPLWQEGIDYKCGTGHGVGYLLNVHEGPHRIASAPNNVALEEGMIVTIEPGVYKAGSHGIRIENVVVVDKDIKTDSGQFMKFETLSFCPIDLECIDGDMLSYKEKDWLNNYHKDVYNKLAPYLNEEEKHWLKKETRKI